MILPLRWNLAGREIRFRCFFVWRKVAVSGFAALLLGAGVQAAEEAVPEQRLTLRDYLDLVVQNNESVQSKVLDVEISRRRARGAYGTFEPELVGNVAREYNRRENTAQEYGQSYNQNIFEERNTLYGGGLESLVPTGARVRLGYSLKDLKNNLQVARAINSGNFTNLPDGEFQSFFGLTLTQPLLKNFGQAATLAEIRVMALNSDIAFQEYRRQLMMVVSTAEASYWNLYLAQEQVRAFQESVAVAQTVLSDSRARVDAGKSSELDVLEAQSALALRKSKLNDALQKLNEAANQVTMLFGSSPTQNTNYMAVRAADRPELKTNDISFYTSWRNAYDLNPDYLAQRQRCVLDGVRVAYAKNQQLPQVDLKASYGLNGLGETPGSSWDDIQQGGFKSWSVGVEVRIPLGGDIKARNERAAAQLNQRKTLIELKGLENQIANAVHTAVQKIQSREGSVPDAESVVSYVQNLLQTEMARLDVGKVETRKVMEVEASLLDAKNTLVETLVQYRRAWLEKELVEGSVLKNRGLDLTKEDLQFGTKRLLKRGSFTQDDLDATMKQLQSLHREIDQTRFPDDELPDPLDPNWSSRQRQTKQAEAATPAASVPPVR